MSAVCPTLMILLVLLLATAGFAATYSVSPAGDDANPGTNERPWCTLQHAVETIQPGDTILVQSGTYVGCRIEHSGRADAICTLKAADGAKVIVNSPPPGSKWHNNIDVGIDEERIGYWVVDGFEVLDSPRYGISLRHCDHVTARNCIVHGSRVTGIVTSFADYVTIENNECYENGEHGIYHANSGDHPIIRGNRSHDNHTCGIHMNGDLNMGGDGMITEALVEGNVLWGTGKGGGSAINCDGVSDSIIRNNLCYDNLASGISLYAIDGTEGSSRNQVLGNTIVVPAEGRWALNIPVSHGGRPNPTGNIALDNILLSANPSTGAITIWDPAALVTSDHNLLTNRLSPDGGKNVLTLDEWQKAGRDEHSLASGVVGRE